MGCGMQVTCSPAMFGRVPDSVGKLVDNKRMPSPNGLSLVLHVRVAKSASDLTSSPAVIATTNDGRALGDNRSYSTASSVSQDARIQ